MKLNKSQEDAIELLKRLVQEDKLTLEELFILLKAIYENTPEVITVPVETPSNPSPNTSPWVSPYPTNPWQPYIPNTPWYDGYPHITCNTNNTNTSDNANSSDHWLHTYNDFGDLFNILEGWDTTITS